jgi:uncharacterized protein YxeA
MKMNSKTTTGIVFLLACLFITLFIGQWMNLRNYSSISSGKYREGATTKTMEEDEDEEKEGFTDAQVKAYLDKHPEKKAKFAADHNIGFSEDQVKAYLDKHPEKKAKFAADHNVFAGKTKKEGFTDDQIKAYLDKHPEKKAKFAADHNVFAGLTKKPNNVQPIAGTPGHKSFKK